jgi:hypothetical protein
MQIHDEISSTSYSTEHLLLEKLDLSKGEEKIMHKYL